MKHYKYHSLKDYINKTDLRDIDVNTLFIFDIDGVFFKGIFDPRELLGIISKETSLAFEEILSKKAPCWIMTNRSNLFRYFPFIKQISKSIEKITSTTPNLYSNCSAFLESGSNKSNIVMNARKPAEDSQEVVKKGIRQYDKVIYIGGRDTPFRFTDEELVEKLDGKISLDNLTLIEIT